MKYTDDELLNDLKEAGLRITPHRFLVYKIISKSRQPLSVKTIIEKADRKEYIDKATIYRNLLSLYEHGLLKKIDINNGQSYYSLETGEVSSQFVCSKCHNIEKVEGVPFDDTIKKMMKKSKKFKGMELNMIEIYGICQGCK
jgi:Fe2+ or Zn2+ uptake regulation protein